MKKKITAILMTAALMLTMAACAGNSTADTGVESSASSAVSSKPVSNTSSTAASSAKPSASAKPTATPSAGTTATAKPTATPKPERKTESSTAGKASATATPKPAATAKPSSSHTSNSKPSGSAARPTPAPTAKPTAAPTAAPTAKPTAAPTAAPTAVPTATPKPKEKVWVVDVPAQEEVGHWEDDYWMGSDWVYQCNGCGAQFATTDAFWAHSDANWDEDGNNYHGGYSMVSGEPYKHYTGEKYWVVDTPAQEEIGHWEYR